MSEFSESYHLRSNTTQDAVDLLKRAGLKGLVYPAENGWVAFVADTSDMFVPEPRLVSANTQLLLHYVWAEDHGWSFALFQGDEQVCAYRCDWEDTVEVDDSALRPEAVQPLVEQQGTSSMAELDAVFHPKSIEDLLDPPGYRFADAVGLKNYQWVDYEHTQRDYAESPAGYPELIVV